MTIDEHLNNVAAKYRLRGYQVVVRPGPDDLPPFAKDFKMEILAMRPDGNVLVGQKNLSAVQADHELGDYADVINKQPGWRMDLFVLESDPLAMADNRDAKDPPEEEVRRSLDEAERMLGAGFVAPSLSAAWAGLESAMRYWLRAHGEKAGWEIPPRALLIDLLSAGGVLISVHQDLQGVLKLRNAIVHGFAAPVVEPSAVQLLLDTARQLLDDLRLPKTAQTA